MKIALSVLVASVLVLASAEEPQCVGLSKEQMDKLKTLIVTEDPHDKLVGNFTQTDGPQFMRDNAELNDESCFVFSRSNVDENTLFRPQINGKKLVLPSKNLKKVSSGVYLKEKLADETMVDEAKNADKYMFILHASDNVIAYMECFADFKPEEPVIPYSPVVDVRKSALKSPMDEAVKTEIQEAEKKVKDNADLWGPLLEYPRCN